jgi:hypothetical protein
MSVLQKLTEGIVNRDLSKEGAALLDKWEQTGLLEGLKHDYERQTMARILENQAKELLREASTMGSTSPGDVEGFAAVAFPIVRRVFGGLIANNLVSVQPMSLPSGLLFFLDFQYTSSPGGLGVNGASSVYGGVDGNDNNLVGQAITGGIGIGGTLGSQLGFYALNQGYSSPTGSATAFLNIYASGTVGGADWKAGANASADSEIMNSICQWDPDLSGSVAAIYTVATASTVFDQLNMKNLVTIDFSSTIVDGRQVRRLTHASGTASPSDPTLFVVVAATGSETVYSFHTNDIPHAGVKFALTDDFGGTPAASSNNAIGAVVGQTIWGLEDNRDIPELDIKVDSVSVTAITKKLKAKWTPELGQDLNAYHNLDAEVELTSVLSEHIALEIDREILEDLVKDAKAATYYWSRRPGKFLNKTTGKSTNGTLHPDFTGTVSEWYETLVETINDVSAQIHRKTLRGGANFLVVSPEVANVLEFTAGFRASITADDDKGVVGAVKTGNLSKKWDVWVDPYFPRNVCLVGRKGGSFLESGYVYAPYVPLQVTPTIFGTEDFVPRKGVMTRYAKKMVRPDMYGVVIVADLLG